jgi:regulator of replication initiation timing
VEKEMTELSKEELFQQQLQVQEKRVKRLFEHYEELRNAMEVILEDNQGLISHCEALEERIAHLEKPWYKKLFRRKAKKCQ